MKTKEKATEVVKEGAENKEFNLTESFVLWKHKSKNGIDYLTGNTSDKDKCKLVGYFNSRKKNPKEPDIRIYSVDDQGNQDIEVCSLWENISSSEKRYLTGTTNDQEKIVAFYGKENEEARPYIRAYYKEN